MAAIIDLPFSFLRTPPANPSSIDHPGLSSAKNCFSIYEVKNLNVVFDKFNGYK